MERGEKIYTGTLKVSENVIATIARIATTIVVGVTGVENWN